MNKFMCFFITITILLFLAIPTPASEMHLYFNNQLIPTDLPLLIVDTNVLCPIRAITDFLNVSATWDEITETIILIKDNKIIKLKINELNYTINEISKNLSCPPQINEGRTFIPVKEIVEEFGYKYYADFAKGNIIIYEGDTIPDIPPLIKLISNTYIKEPDTNRDIYAEINYNNHMLQNIFQDNYELLLNIDYELNDNYIVFKKEFLRNLDEGVCTFLLKFDHNIHLYVNITIIVQEFIPKDSNFVFYVDDKEVFLDTPFYIINNEFYISIRSFSEALKIKANWDSQTSTITFDNLYKIIKVKPNVLSYTANNQFKSLTMPVLIVNGRTLLPLKVFAEEFGCMYQKDIIFQKINIKTPSVIIDSIGYGDTTIIDFINNPSINLNVISKSARNITFVIAFYDKYHHLVKIEHDNYPLSSGYNNLNISLTSIQATDQIATVKIFTWSNVSNIQPINDDIIFDENGVLYN